MMSNTYSRYPRTARHSPAKPAACRTTLFAMQKGRVEERRGCRGMSPAPFPFPAHQTGRADLPHPAFRQTSSRAHAGDLIEAAANRHPTFQRRPRLKTDGCLGNASLCDAGGGNAEPDRRRNDSQWRTAGPRPRMRNSSATHATSRSGGHELVPMVGCRADAATHKRSFAKR
jgi:hypothetical protein